MYEPYSAVKSAKTDLRTYMRMIASMLHSIMTQASACMLAVDNNIIQLYTHK